LGTAIGEGAAALVIGIENLWNDLTSWFDDDDDEPTKTAKTAPVSKNTFSSPINTTSATTIEKPTIVSPTAANTSTPSQQPNIFNNTANLATANVPNADINSLIKTQTAMQEQMLARFNDLLNINRDLLRELKQRG